MNSFKAVEGQGAKESTYVATLAGIYLSVNSIGQTIQKNQVVFWMWYAIYAKDGTS